MISHALKTSKSFLSTKETKANLVLYLAHKAVQLCKVSITTHTHKGIISSQPNMVNILSTQEEADTLYAVAMSCHGNTVHIYSCGTNVLVFVLQRFPCRSQAKQCYHHGYWTTNQTQAHLCCSRCRKSSSIARISCAHVAISQNPSDDEDFENKDLDD